MKYYNDVKAFHDKFGLNTPDSFYQIPLDLHNFRVKFFHEELLEYVEACEINDIETAVDSLIDLVYITCGATMLHGLKPTIFWPPNPEDTFIAFKYQPLTFTHVRIVNKDQTPLLMYTELAIKNGVIKAPPKFLGQDDFVAFKDSMRIQIEKYHAAYEQENQDGISAAFNTMFWNCLDAALMMNIDHARWDLLWDDVQRANMTKVRAESSSQSKRGSAWDVVKPPGWQGPKTKEMIDLMLAGEL